MRKILLTILMAIVYLLIGDKLFSPVEAAYFQFDPSSVNSGVGETVSIKININAESDELSSADAYIIYDSNYLKVQSITDGDYFPTVSKDTSVNGRIYIAGMVDYPATSSRGTGTLATIVFQAQADAQTTLTIDCNSSKIVKNDIDASNVLQCSQNNQVSLTIGSGSTTNGDSTTNRDKTLQPTPSSLPKSGIFENILNLAVPGMILFFLGAVTRLFL